MNDVADYRHRIATELLGTTKQAFDLYFKHYDRLVVPDADVYAVQLEKPQPGDLTPISHADVLEAVGVIRADPGKTLDQTTDELHEKLKVKHSRPRVKYAVQVAVRIMFMFDPAMNERHGPDYSIGTYIPVSWQPHQSLHQFVLQCFPKSAKSSERVQDAIAEGRLIKAWKLKARSGITFKGTDNLAQHLLLDSRNRVLYIFHHTSFLKAQLRRFQSTSSGTDEDPLLSLQR
ncbi:hypothetical protein QQX98_008944 [Neonectria punicea]|uniref:Uncharacterized protein n=1 Tax=Neonectria punicea TaxID=979145 RepID=A0ABR1GTR8_9HYPO